MRLSAWGTVVLGLAVGVAGCRGNPTGDLNRGTPTGLQADPSVIFIDQGSSIGVIVEAKDNLNQVVEMSDISAIAGTGVTILRDSTYNRVYDASGNLVLPEHPTRARFVVTGLNAIQTSVTVNSNGLSLTLPVRVVPVAVTPPLSTTTPGYGQDVTLTLQDDIVIDPAVVADVAQWQGLVQFPGLPDALVSDVQPQSITFQVPPNVNGPATVRRIVMPYAPAVDSLTLVTSEDIVSPVLDTVAVTLSNNAPAGLDIVTITLNETDVRFGGTSEFGLEGTGGNCSLDALCTKMVVESRAPDGTSVTVFMPPDITGQLWVSGVEPINAPNYPTDVRGDKAIAVGPSTFTVTYSAALPASGVGAEVVHLVAGPGYSFASTATIADVYVVGVDPAGAFIDYVPEPGTTQTPVIQGVVPNAAPAFEFDLPSNIEITVAPSTFTTSNTQATAEDITSLLPASGASIEWYDIGTFGGDVFGTDRVYNINSAFNITVDLDWSNDADVDILFVDNPATAVVESPGTCVDGASSAQPESASCALGAGAWSLLLDLFGGTPPKVVKVTITGN